MQSVTPSFNLTHAAWVIVGTAISMWVLLAYGFGWMSPGTHRTLAALEVQEALVPICAERFKGMPEEVAKYNAAQSYNRSGIVRAAVPKLGTHEVDYTLARLCTDALGDKLTTAAVTK